MAERPGDLIEKIGRRQRGRGRLAPPVDKPPLDVTRAEAEPVAPDVGGVAWPLTERAGERTYHETPQIHTSPDGLFVLEVYQVATASFVDGNGDSGEMTFVNE